MARQLGAAPDLRSEDGVEALPALLQQSAVIQHASVVHDPAQLPESRRDVEHALHVRLDAGIRRFDTHGRSSRLEPRDGFAGRIVRSVSTEQDELARAAFDESLGDDQSEPAQTATDDVRRVTIQLRQTIGQVDARHASRPATSIAESDLRLVRVRLDQFPHEHVDRRIIGRLRIEIDGADIEFRMFEGRGVSHAPRGRLPPARHRSPTLHPPPDRPE